VVTNENTKDDIFSIVTLNESDLKNLANLFRRTTFRNFKRRTASLELKKKIKQIMITNTKLVPILKA
jgi:hypothetical protein